MITDSCILCNAIIDSQENGLNSKIENRLLYSTESFIVTPCISPIELGFRTRIIIPLQVPESAGACFRASTFRVSLQFQNRAGQIHSISGCVSVSGFGFFSRNFKRQPTFQIVLPAQAFAGSTGGSGFSIFNLCL